MNISFLWPAFVLPLLFFSASNAGPETPEGKAIKPALLVIDIQNEYLSMISEQERNPALQTINRVIRMFRDSAFPVIRVYNSDLKNDPMPGTEGFEFPSSVGIKPEDPRIVKNYPNAFKRTELDQWLRREGCNTLFLCGLNAVYCVLATYHGAADLDYDVFLVKDAVVSHNPSYTRFVEDILSAVGLKALAIILEQAREKR